MPGNYWNLVRTQDGRNSARRTLRRREEASDEEKRESICFLIIDVRFKTYTSPTPGKREDDFLGKIFSKEKKKKMRRNGRALEKRRTNEAAKIRREKKETNQRDLAEKVRAKGGSSHHSRKVDNEKVLTRAGNG